MNKFRTYLLLILTLIWMIFIFSMSAKPADKSTDISITFGRLFCELFYPGYDDMTQEEQFFTAEGIDHPLRKAAHVTEFAVLGMLTTMSAGELTEGKKKRYLIGFLVSVLYAASDELHQLFVPGRSAEIKDVLIDSAGVLIGIAVIAVLSFALKMIRKQATK